MLHTQAPDTDPVNTSRGPVHPVFDHHRAAYYIATRNKLIAWHRDMARRMAHEPFQSMLSWMPPRRLCARPRARTHTHIQTHTHAHTRVCTHTRTHTHTHTCTHTCTRAHTHTHTHTHMYTHARAYTHICARTHAHTHPRMHMHTHAYTHMQAACFCRGEE